MNNLGIHQVNQNWLGGQAAETQQTAEIYLERALNAARSELKEIQNTLSSVDVLRTRHEELIQLVKRLENEQG